VTSLHFRVAGYAAEPGDATIEIESLSPHQRFVRAAKGFGIMFGIAILCIGIPIAHFVLVPGCLVGAFIFAAVRYSQRAVVRSAHGRCPDCGAEQDFDLHGPWKGPRDQVCRSCHRPLRLISDPSPLSP
jgi:hypothetical protein